MLGVFLSKLIILQSIVIERASRGMNINNSSKHFQYVTFVIERVTSGLKVAGSLDDLQEQAVEKQSRL